MYGGSHETYDEAHFYTPDQLKIDGNHVRLGYGVLDSSGKFHDHVWSQPARAPNLWPPGTSQPATIESEASLLPSLGFDSSNFRPIQSEPFPAVTIPIHNPEDYLGSRLDEHTIERNIPNSPGIFDGTGIFPGMRSDSRAVVEPANNLLEASLYSDGDSGIFHLSGVSDSGDTNLIRQQDALSNHNLSSSSFKVQLPTKMSRSISPQYQMPDLTDPDYVWVRMRRKDQTPSPRTSGQYSSGCVATPHTSSINDCNLARNVDIRQLDDLLNLPIPMTSPVLVQALPRRKRQRIVTTRPRTDRKYRLVSCEECHEEFQANLLARHRREVHEQLSPFVCEGCGHSFKRMNYLRAHNEKNICANGVKKQKKRRQRGRKQTIYNREPQNVLVES